jgi:hypothetical protein
MNHEVRIGLARLLSSGTLLLLFACGGSGGGGSSATKTSTNELVQQIPWQSSTVLSDRATITMDGQPSQASQLRDGDIVTMRSTVTVQNTNGSQSTTTTLRSVDDEAVVRGPVDSIDLEHRRLVVMGQPVEFTRLKTNGCGECDADAALPGVTVGSLARVSGFTSVAGPIFAGRIDASASTSTVRVTGIPTAIDAGTRRFQLNALTVSYDGAEMDADALEGGDRVTVVGALSANPRQLVATRVQKRDSLIAANRSADQVTLRGLVDSIADNEAMVDGTPVALVNRICDLVVNVPTEVVGPIDSHGAIDAVNCSPLNEGGLVLRGEVDAVDPIAKTLFVLGVAVQTTFTTRVSDDSSPPMHPQLSDLSHGDFVEVGGLATARSPKNGVVAEVVSRTESGPMIMSGAPSSLNEPDVVIFGQTVQTDAATTFALQNCGAPSTVIDATTYFQRPIATQEITVERAGNDHLRAVHIDVTVSCFDY